MYKFLAIFGLGMGAFFLLAGVSMMFLNPEPVRQMIEANKWPTWSGQAVGFIVFVYGVFRLNRSIKTLRNKKEKQSVVNK